MNTSDIFEKAIQHLRNWYKKGNEVMDAVPLLKTKRNKTTAWICLALIVLVAICRICGGGDGGTSGGDSKFSFDGAPLGAETPEAVVMQYYKAYKDGDAVAYLNCVNYTDEEKLCIIGPLSEKMSETSWCTIANCAYAKVKYESEELRPYDADLGCEWATANAYVEASTEWEGSTKYAGRIWNMKKVGGKWFIDKNSGSGAHWMGLTDLANPDPTKPSN